MYMYVYECMYGCIYYLCIYVYVYPYRPVAGGGGAQLPIPKILFHPLAILFHPLANLCKGCVTGTDRSPPPPPLGLGIWMTSHGQCPRGGGGCACECPRGGGVFQFFRGRMTSRGQCPRGGACECPRVGTFFQIDDVTRTMSKGGVRLVFHPSKFRPPPPHPHLAGYGPAIGPTCIGIMYVSILTI